MGCVLVAVALLAAGPDSEAAFADLARFPPEEHGYYVYLTTSTVPAEQREKLVSVLRFVVPSLSSRTYLAEQLPVAVPNTNLLRLSLRGLGWDPASYRDVLLAHYVPLYRPDLQGQGRAPLVVRGDWFAANLLDPLVTGDAQYRLLYGQPPADAVAFLKFWAIGSDPEYVFGAIENRSGVATQLVRLIENRPGGKRNRCWLTRDSKVVAGETDPLENLPNRVKFDAQELIVEMPKWYGGKSGSLQAYFLAAGDGKRQEVAPAAIVVDHTGLRGVEIRNSISCIACHVDGIRQPSVNGFRSYIESGARVSFPDKSQQQATDRYHGSDVAKEVAAGQQAYADGVQLCNGLTPVENAAAYMAVVRAYDQPVSLEQAAREVYCTPDQLRLALGDYSRRYGLTGRLAELAQGRPISRDQFVANFARLQEILALWHAQ